MLIAIGAVAALVVAIVVVVIVTGSGGGSSGRPGNNAIDWATHDVRVTADNFYIVSDGLVFTARDADVSGDPAEGTGTTTLEVAWSEHDRLMRLSMSFEVVGGTRWRVSEIRIDSAATTGDTAGDTVVFAEGYFEMPLAQTYRTDAVELVAADGTVLSFARLAVLTGFPVGDEGRATTVPARTAPAPTTGTVPTSAPAPMRDEFDGRLAAGWTWVNEDPTHWRIDEGTDRLTIVAQASPPIANLLVRPAPGGDYAVVTEVRFDPVANFQFAGIVVTGEDPDSDRLQFGRAFCDSVGCVGDGLYFDRVEDGAFVVGNRATAAELPQWVFLRIVVRADTATASYSIDGSTWVDVGTHQLPDGATSVGLVAHQAPSEVDATFEFFEIVA